MPLGFPLHGIREYGGPKARAGDGTFYPTAVAG